MKFTPIELEGAYLIELEPKLDNRGSFARTFCTHEFESHLLPTQYVQMSTCTNHKKGQIRGMHFQAAPHEESKVVRCIRGAIYDVIVDLRENSPTYMKSFGIELSQTNNKMLFIPKLFAHGYKTLTEDTEIFYMMDAFYHPEAAQEICHKQFF